MAGAPFLAFLATASAYTAERPAAALNQLQLLVSAKETITEGEPIEITLHVRNVASQKLTANLNLNPARPMPQGRLDFYVKRQGGYDRIAIILATGLLASDGAAASSESLRLKLSAPAEIMVGEPTKLRTTWTAVRDVAVVPAKVQVWLDGGTGFRLYHETSFGTASTVYLPETLKRDASLVTEQVLAVSGYAGGPEDRHFALAFPRPGRYRARVQYEGVVSNVVTIEATKPKGKDDEVLAHLLRRPELLSEWGMIEDFGGPVYEKLLDEYPTSRYLAYPRVLSWRKELEEARAADQQSAAIAGDGKMGRLLAKLENAALDETPFEGDRLLLVGEVAASTGDRAKARATYERLTSHHPTTAAAMKAKRWLTLEDRAVSRDQVQ